MGYDLHITRKEDWSDEDGPALDRGAWEKLVASDPTLQPDLQNGPNDYLFKSGNAEWPLWWNPRLCEIYTKNPPDDAIEKLKEIANQLGATVQGDDGEAYD